MLADGALQEVGQSRRGLSLPRRAKSRVASVMRAECHERFAASIAAIAISSRAFRHASARFPVNEAVSE